MKYDYAIGKGDKVVKFQSKKAIIEWVKTHMDEIKGELTLIRIVKKEKTQMVDDLKAWVIKGDYKLVDEEAKAARALLREEAKAKILTDLAS